MPIKLYNTLTRRKEVFTPLKKGRVSFYACGPTVYDFSHIGNFRTYLFEDILRRVLEYNGYKVRHVMNFTDVGHLVSDADEGQDKMEKADKNALFLKCSNCKKVFFSGIIDAGKNSILKNNQHKCPHCGFINIAKDNSAYFKSGEKPTEKSIWQIADFYIAAFKRDAALLNIEKPAVYARATEHIKEQIALIKILEKRGYTYITDDGVYFNTAMLSDYGALAKLDIEGLKAGARIESVAGKKNPTDFALWKFTPSETRRQMEWKSPWAPPGSRVHPEDLPRGGKVMGFPGWHLECSAMSQKYLGEQFDIHAGAIDLIPVHHTNEIAQSEAAYGQNPARYWMHGEFVLVDSAKMAKSLGNFITISKIAEKFNPLAFRYLVLTAHYRSQLNLTWESLEAAQTALNNLYQQTRELKENADPFWPLIKIAGGLGLAGRRTSAELKTANQYREKFREFINDDLNTPEALALVWQILADRILPPAAKKDLLLEFDNLFGLSLAKIKPARVPEQVKRLVAQREAARQDKNWAKADELRDQIAKRGWLVEDTPQGPKLVEKQIRA